MTFKATLSPQSEVPPHAALKGSGTVSATYDSTTKKLDYKVSYEGLTGLAVAAHFHGPAAPGKNAGDGAGHRLPDQPDHRHRDPDGRSGDRISVCDTESGRPTEMTLL